MKSLIASVITFAAVGCVPQKSDLKIVNSTDDVIRSLQLSGGGEVWYLYDLEPGQSITFSDRVSGEGGPRLTWSWNGDVYGGEGCYYSQPLNGPEGELAIAGATLEVIECR